MLSRVIKWIILIGLLAALAWFGMCVYALVNPDTGLSDMPDRDKAQYSLRIQNTGGLLMTDDFEEHGYQIGKRVFVLHGYWELSGKDFRFRDQDIVLDEAIFGRITVEKR